MIVLSWSMVIYKVFRLYRVTRVTQVTFLTNGKFTKGFEHLFACL